MLEVLVDSSSFSDFLTRFSYLQQMLRQDVQLLHEVKDEKARIETEKAQLEEKRANVASLKAQAAEQLATIAAIRDKKASQLAETTEEIEAIKQQLEELDRISQEVQDRLQKLEQEYDEELKRRGISFTGLEWPLPRGGWISSPYGPRFHPILHEWKQHTGVDVAIGQGTPIYAAAAGKVIYAGWLGGYGNTVIIAHGKGTDGNSYSTLYAHGSALYVKKNTFVKQGQRIASVGSTGYSTGPHLHLEVRVNGEHKNPLHYISKP
jgi:murein DD-endopeptidase MepM/ murein hydrolase activator NlpD